MAIYMGIFPIKNGGSVHSYVKLPEAMIGFHAVERDSMGSMGI